MDLPSPSGQRLLISRSADSDGLGTFRDQRFGGCFGLLVCLTFGVDVAQFVFAGLYGQGHFHPPISWPPYG
jgi:hypothetical protein